MKLEGMKKAAARIWEDVKAFKWMLAAFFLYYILIKHFTGAFCPMVILTGLPCPGCGLTRAALFMATGQFARAMRANPAILLWMVFAVYGFIQRYIRGRKIKYALHAMGGIAAVMLLVYLYRMITVFPNRPPMSVTYHNVLSELFPFYREFLRGL